MLALAVRELIIFREIVVETDFTCIYLTSNGMAGTLIVFSGVVSVNIDSSLENPLIGGLLRERILKEYIARHRSSSRRETRLLSYKRLFCIWDATAYVDSVL